MPLEGITLVEASCRLHVCRASACDRERVPVGRVLLEEVSHGSGNDPAHRADLGAPGRRADLALQSQLGVLPEWPGGFDRPDRADPTADRTPLRPVYRLRCWPV